MLPDGVAGLDDRNELIRRAHSGRREAGGLVTVFRAPSARSALGRRAAACDKVPVRGRYFVQQFTRRAALAGAAGLPGACAIAPQLPADTGPALDAIDRIFAPAAPSQGPGYAVGVIKDGEFIHARGYGLANIEDGVPITIDTAFHIASLSKQFTGAAVALTLLDGRLDLEDPVARHVPEMAWAPQVLVKHLVYMTSGLPEYSSLPRTCGLPWFSPYRFTTAEAIATVMVSRRLDFEPGAQWAYRNINYMLLAEIVARLSGQSFASFVAQRVFAPLAMSSSLVDDDALAVIARRAAAYAPAREVAGDLASVDIAVTTQSPWLRLNRTSPHYGGSGVFTSIADWRKWDANWSNPVVGGPDFVALMHRRMRFQHSKDNDGFGLVFGERRGRAMIWYSGGDLDASSYVARFPDQQATMICLSNNPHGAAEAHALAAVDALIEAGVI